MRLSQLMHDTLESDALYMDVTLDYVEAECAKYQINYLTYYAHDTHNNPIPGSYCCDISFDEDDSLLHLEFDNALIMCVNSPY